GISSRTASQPPQSGASVKPPNSRPYGRQEVETGCPVVDASGANNTDAPLTARAETRLTIDPRPVAVALLRARTGLPHEQHPGDQRRRSRDPGGAGGERPHRGVLPRA